MSMGEPSKVHVDAVNRYTIIEDLGNGGYTIISQYSFFIDKPVVGDKLKLRSIDGTNIAIVAVVKVQGKNLFVTPSRIERERNVISL